MNIFHLKNIYAALSLFLSAYIQNSLSFDQNFFIALKYTLCLTLELFSLYLLPLSSYTLLISLHLLLKSFISSYISSKKLKEQHQLANSLIIIGCFITLAVCGFQKEVNEMKDIENSLNYWYIVWNITTLSLNILMRHTGAYSGRIFIETSIPAQLSAFSYSSQKILCLIINLHSQEKTINANVAIWCSAVCLLSLILSGLYMHHFYYDNDKQIVFAGYYFWLLFYCFPVGISLINPGVDYGFIEYSGLAFASVMIAYGSYLHTFIFKKQEEAKNEDIVEKDTLIEI